MADWYVAAIILAVLVALMALFHDDVSAVAAGMRGSSANGRSSIGWSLLRTG